MTRLTYQTAFISFITAVISLLVVFLGFFQSNDPAEFIVKNTVEIPPLYERQQIGIDDFEIYYESRYPIANIGEIEFPDFTGERGWVFGKIQTFNTTNQILQDCELTTYKKLGHGWYKTAHLVNAKQFEKVEKDWVKKGYDYEREKIYTKSVEFPVSYPNQEIEIKLARASLGESFALDLRCPSEGDGFYRSKLIQLNTENEGFYYSSEKAFERNLTIVVVAGVFIFFWAVLFWAYKLIFVLPVWLFRNFYNK